jgi:hypothetical protein
VDDVACPLVRTVAVEAEVDDADLFGVRIREGEEVVVGSELAWMAPALSGAPGEASVAMLLPRSQYADDSRRSTNEARPDHRVEPSPEVSAEQRRT